MSTAVVQLSAYRTLDDSVPPLSAADHVRVYVNPITGTFYLSDQGGAFSAIPSTGSGGVVTSITGTANQVTASAAVGAVTLSLPSPVVRDLTGNVTGNVTGNTSGSAGSCTGNAATATVLQTARNINGVSFNGSAAITIGTLFGDGSDGDVTVGGTTTLTRDMQYNNLTLGATDILNTAGFRVFVLGTLAITSGGVIACNGTAGGPGVLGGGGLGGGGGGASATLVFGAAGGTGGRGASPVSSGTANGTGSAAGTSFINAGVAMSTTIGCRFLMAGAGGGAGGGHGTTPGNGGAAGSTWSLSALAGAGGNGSGADNVLLGGGGGGGGGGVCFVFAATINNAGSITANGGNGGNGLTGTTSKSGNGGGGGGGVVIVVWHATTGSGVGTLTAAAGNVGTGGNGGANGNAGYTTSYQM